MMSVPAPSIGEAHPILGSTDVIIDVGHGGIDSGTLYGTIEEKTINLAIAKQIYGILSKKGYIVILNRVDDYALSEENHWLRTRNRHRKDLAQRTHLANEVKPKVLISLHVNWAARSSKNGAIVLHQKNRQSILLAQLLQKRLNAAYGAEEAPVYGKPFYLLNHSKIPSVIIEVGFITNDKDRQRMTSRKGQRLIAENIAASVLEYLAATTP
ncbi:N-acetylmuramoyl-L-alanine amidase [Paenibacillus thalictri]|uniref:N-acetylmuramoyl-L-alanine amidase n=2 Tax=Paenibacillus thalictri TaxID=2527873 RepID=A0A4Q9DXK9_9BACL|nr:N-acetylmuramoyl-L-alanine amidase [Paenibacillus thalictri]